MNVETDKRNQTFDPSFGCEGQRFCSCGNKKDKYSTSVSKHNQSFLVCAWVPLDPSLPQTSLGIRSPLRDPAPQMEMNDPFCSTSLSFSPPLPSLALSPIISVLFSQLPPPSASRSHQGHTNQLSTHSSHEISAQSPLAKVSLSSWDPFLCLGVHFNK